MSPCIKTADFAFIFEVLLQLLGLSSYCDRNIQKADIALQIYTVSQLKRSQNSNPFKYDINQRKCWSDCKPEGPLFSAEFVCLSVSDRHFYPSTLTDFDETWSQGPTLI